MFKSRVIIVLFTVLFSSRLLFGQSFTASGPSSATVGFGNSTVNVTYYFSYSNTGGLTVPKLAIAVDGNYIAGFLCQGADPYLPSSYTFSLAPGSHTLTFKLQSLGSGIPDCASSANVWQTSTASVNCNFQISIENIFGGGTISVDGTGGRFSPVRRATSGGDNVSIGAEVQDYGGYHWIWNTNGTNNSEWDRVPQNLPGSYYSSTQNTSYSVQSNDASTKVVAALRKICNVTFQNSFAGGGTGGTVIVGGTQYNSPTSSFQVTELNPISATAQNQILNYIDYTFLQWSNGSASATTTFNPSSTITFNANFSGKPYNGYRHLTINTTVGQPVLLNWWEHPNTGVTEYRIFRKVRPSGGVTSAEVQIGTVARGTTTFTDYDYVISNMFYYQLYYDVRAYYQPSGSTADPDFLLTFGQIAPSYNDGKKEIVSAAQELPSDYSIGNYPNPFNPTTTINYQLPENGFVTIKVFDILGKEVTTLVNENKSTGYYNINFDASKLTSGVYIYTINVNGFAQSKKMLLMK